MVANSNSNCSYNSLQYGSNRYMEAQTMIKALLTAITTAVLAVGVVSVLPSRAQTPEPVHSASLNECPQPTSEGAYFERGIDKDGNVICGFAYYNECPYAAGYSATNPMCDKLGQQQEPVQTNVIEYGGK